MPDKKRTVGGIRKMPQPPALTTEQRRQAYERSLELRRDRASLKAWLLSADGPASTKMDMAFNTDCAQGMKVIDLLAGLPGIARKRAESLLGRSGIPTKNTVRACGPKQRERLFSLLEARTPRRAESSS